MNTKAESVRVTGPSSAPLLERRIDERIRDASEKLASVDRDLQRFVRRKPMTAALTALAVGFILGRIASRI